MPGSYEGHAFCCEGQDLGEHGQRTCVACSGQEAWLGEACALRARGAYNRGGLLSSAERTPGPRVTND